jgi:four helix bundle protein
MKYNLEERLITYSVLILDIVDDMPDNRGANHLSGQLVRSGTAPALMYGEAQASESRKDFIHKMKMPLKELRETFNCLKIISEKKYIIKAQEKLTRALKESDELIAIFVKSISTALKNSKQDSRS